MYDYVSSKRTQITFCRTRATHDRCKQNVPASRKPDGFVSERGLCSAAQLGNYFRVLLGMQLFRSISRPRDRSKFRTDGLLILRVN
jgi:hypothetical protein